MAAVGLVLFLLLLAVSLTNAKAVDVNPDLVKEIAQQESIHAPGHVVNKSRPTFPSLAAMRSGVRSPQAPYEEKP